MRLSQIDELTAPDHYYLDASDDRSCFYLREYTPRGGWKAGETNQLIFNLRKPMSRKGQPGWAYKDQAIRQCAHELQKSLFPELSDWVRGGVLIAIPPSKSPGDPDYDDRLEQLLGRIDTRDLCTTSSALSTRVSVEPSHTRVAERLTPPEVARNLAGL